MSKKDNTANAYGFLWKKTNITTQCNRWHFNYIQDIITEPIIRGKIGIDVGSGCGYDTYIMANNSPQVRIVSMDISDGVYKTKEITSSLDNVRIIKSSVLNIPFKDNIFDFAYSFGVLHHTSNPENSLLEIARILKKNCPAFVYLYEDHSENPMKYIAIKLISWLRIITVKLPSEIVYTLSWFFAPFIYITFTIPSKILMKYSRTKNFAKKMPFSFAKSFFSLRGDLYDRFSAPIEHRFNRQKAFNLFTECGFCNVTVSGLIDRSGWVVWGYKK